MSKICIQWPRLGPYHLARLNALHNALAIDSAYHLVALETAGGDSVYEWAIETQAVPFERRQLFPEESFESISPVRIRQKVLKALDQIDPDVVGVNSYSAPDSRAALEWARTHRRCAILMTPSTSGDAPRTFGRELVKRTLVQAADAALTSGSRSADYMNSLGLPRERIFSPYAAVDNAYFNAAANRARQTRPDLPGLSDSIPFFLCVSRFVERKNLRFLLEAYAAYRQRADAPWRLVLLGNGRLRPSLEQQVQEQKIEGVTFAGFRQIHETPVYYAHAGALVLPSTVDQWGLVVNEAMATGLPALVSTGCGCADDLISGRQTGCTFDPYTLEALVACMEWMSSLDADTRRKIGDRAKEVISSYSPSAFAEALLQAARAGLARSNRGLDLRSRSALLILRLLERRVGQFYAIAE